MITYNSLLALNQEFMQAVPEVKFTGVIIHRDHLVRILKDRTQQDNTMLIAMLPSYKTTGELDAVEDISLLQFLILNKNNYSNFSLGEYLQTFEQTVNIARQLRRFILEAKDGDSAELCHILAKASENTIEIHPIWELSGCDGYSLEIDVTGEI